MDEAVLEVEDTGKTLLGIKVVVNPYMPDDCIVVSPKIFGMLKAAALAESGPTK